MKLPDKSSAVAAPEYVGILFGHHMGDLQENVFTNFMNGRSILDLCVMSEQSIVNDVLVWRPLLAHEKKEIFEFAHQFHVPNFLDTTPRWSTRGKLRNETFPHLSAQYGNFQSNLSLLGSSSMEWAAIIQQVVLQPFYASQVRFLPLGALVNCSLHYHLPQAFWREVFRHVFFSMGFSTPPSHKSLSLILDVCLSRGSRARPQWLNLRRDSAVHYNFFDMLVFHPQFIHPTSAPLSIDAQLPTPGPALPVVQYTTPDAKWEITLKRVAAEDIPRLGLQNALLEKVTHAELLSGHFSYYLADCPPFAIGGKCRPTSFIHLMLKNHLPLVGTPKKSLKASSDLIHIDIQWVEPIRSISECTGNDDQNSNPTSSS